MSEKIVLILDAGSQYIKLIDKMVRNLNYRTEIKPLNIKLEELDVNQYGAIIISGGPNSIYETDAIKCDEKIFNLGIPILGICYGFQLINFMMGGKVGKKIVKENRENGQQA